MSVLTRSRLLGGAVALSGVAASVAGCGSSHATHAAPASAQIGGSAIAQAADVSGAAQGEKVTYSLTAQLPSVGKLRITGTGAFNTTPEQGQANFDISIPGIKSMGTEASALSNLSLTVVLDNKVIYVKLPSALAGKLATYTGSKPWVSLDLVKLASMSKIPGLSTVLNGQTSPTNPAAAFSELQAASSTGVTKVATATVNGVATTEYKATLNLNKLSRQLPAARRQLLQRQLAQARQLGLTSIPVDVYIDSAHLIRRLLLNYTFSLQGNTVPLMMKFDFLAYGQQPAPTVPSAPDTFDATNLLSMYGSSLGAGQTSTTTPLGG